MVRTIWVLQLLDSFDHSLADDVFGYVGLLVAMIMSCATEAAAEMTMIADAFGPESLAAEMTTCCLSERLLILWGPPEGRMVEHDTVEICPSQLEETEQAVDISVSTSVELQPVLFWHDETVNR